MLGVIKTGGNVRFENVRFRGQKNSPESGSKIHKTYEMYVTLDKVSCIVKHATSNFSTNLTIQEVLNDASERWVSWLSFYVSHEEDFRLLSGTWFFELKYAHRTNFINLAIEGRGHDPQAWYDDYLMCIFERNRKTSEVDFRAPLEKNLFKLSHSNSSRASQINELDEKPIDRDMIQSHMMWEIERHGEKISQMMLTCSGYHSKDITAMVDNIDNNITQSHLVMPIFQHKNDLDGINMMIIWRSITDLNSNTSVSCIRLSAAFAPKSTYFRGELLPEYCDTARPRSLRGLIRVPREQSLSRVRYNGIVEEHSNIQQDLRCQDISPQLA